MTSGQLLETNRNKRLSDSNPREGFREQRLIRVVIVTLLAATGFIHWYLPIVHPMGMPGELTGGIIVIPHELLHILFDLNGVGYFMLVALVAGRLSVSAHHQRQLYIGVAGYAALTILAWVLLSDPRERGVLDYADKLIELLIIFLEVWMAQQFNKDMATLRGHDR